MRKRKFRMGWDVGAWHCDRNKKSRDALVVLEVSDDVPQPLGRPWWGNLRDTLTTIKGVSLVRGMLALCDVREAGPLDLTVAIDTPLGWPRAMLTLATGGESVYVPKDDALNPYTRRETEIDLIRGGHRPLSGVRDMIGSQSTKGIHFLRAAGLRLSSCGVWKFQQGDVSVTAIETYPTVAIKHKDILGLHEKILTALRVANRRINEDIKNALTCGLVAHLFSDIPDSTDPVPSNAPRLEGWIIVPRKRG